MSTTTSYFVCDLRPEFLGRPYITFWRPKNSNYAWPLAWAGRYTIGELKPGYHEVRHGRTVERFAVPCEAVERLAVKSKPGQIDGGVWDVVADTASNRRALRAKRIKLIPDDLRQRAAQRLGDPLGRR